MVGGPGTPGWWLASDGRWYPPPAPPVPQYGPSSSYSGHGQFIVATTSGLAVAALVLSIVWLGGIGSVLAVVFGILAVSQIGKSHGLKRGRGLATAGIVIGSLGLVGTVIFYVAAVEVGQTLVNRITTPTTLTLGQTGTIPNCQRLDDACSVTAYSISYPVVSGTPAILIPAGDKLAVVNVKACAGSNGIPSGPPILGWEVSLSLGGTVGPAPIPVMNPQFASGGSPVAPGQCVRGFLGFEIPAGSTVTTIQYDEAIIYRYQWPVDAPTPTSTP